MGTLGTQGTSSLSVTSVCAGSQTSRAWETLEGSFKQIVSSPDFSLPALIKNLYCGDCKNHQAITNSSLVMCIKGVFFPAKTEQEEECLEESFAIPHLQRSMRRSSRIEHDDESMEL